MTLPPLYAGWLDQLLGGPIPAETNATCDSCAMLLTESETAVPLAESGYNPATKCCTYLPELSNFLVGGVLLDDHPDAARGRATVEARVDRGVAVTPLGLGKSQTFDLLYANGRAHTFGQSRALLCPHYLDEQDGRCSVWRHRESTCATWFCKHVRGAVGKTFWSNLHQLLHAAERALAGWTLLELGLDDTILAHLYEPYFGAGSSKLTGPDLDGTSDPAELRAAWGRWRGHERELYVECARLVAPLTWSDVVRIGGARMTIYGRLVQDAYARLSSEAVPEHPAMALVQITPRPNGRARLATYSEIDALEVPSVVARILPYFDGRPIAETLEQVRRTEGVRVEPSLVRKLADFGILRDSAIVPPS